MKNKKKKKSLIHGKKFLKRPEVALLQCFPYQNQATSVMAVLDILSNHSQDEEYLGNQLEAIWDEDPVIKAAFEHFNGRGFGGVRAWGFEELFDIQIGGCLCQRGLELLLDTFHVVSKCRCCSIRFTWSLRLKGRTFNSFSVDILASNFIACNLSYQLNSFYFFVFLEEHSCSSPGVEDAQAIALQVYGDKAAFYGCGMHGAQDTLLYRSGRHHVEDCFIQGSIDFIFGDGRSLYQSWHERLLGTFKGFGAATIINGVDDILLSRYYATALPVQHGQKWYHKYRG
ncbi:hypothetical protein FEM48_Zijuj03G0013300 [Ziziphus jujuba var. spinosa]|uniref:Pectinesterase n=1 Tax=Ziziphus jujuba var. spinosa TaxID=714518 RepID=A0A978VMB6_ZIZJJ|nr:hypothetical protein FEM48_Zijuj03G0013300 [Ziziphus jujuba var. spinosa]